MTPRLTKTRYTRTQAAVKAPAPACRQGRQGAHNRRVRSASDADLPLVIFRHSLPKIPSDRSYAAISWLADMTVEAWQRTIAVTLSGVFYGMRFALPQMLVQGGGVIVNTASVSGLAADYMLGAYNAAKAGVINLTRTAAIEYARKNIRVNAVCPGSIATPQLVGKLGEGEGRRLLEDAHPIGRLGLPEEIARIVLFLASDDASLVTGSIVVADGGISAQTGFFGRPL